MLLCGDGKFGFMLVVKMESRKASECRWGSGLEGGLDRANETMRFRKVTCQALLWHVFPRLNHYLLDNLYYTVVRIAHILDQHMDSLR